MGLTSNRNQTQQAWRERNKRRYVENRVSYQYGLSTDRYRELKAAGCGLCGNHFLEKPLCKEDAPNVDHDHRCCQGRNSCGRCVRGLLCRICNQQFIAAIEKNPRLRAFVDAEVLRYLDQHFLGGFMSTVKDVDGNILNRPPIQIEGKYVDAGTASLVQDWFETHPESVEAVDEIASPVLSEAVVPVVEPVAEPVVEPVAEPVVEPVAEPVAAPVEFHASEVPATLPEHSGETLVVVDSATAPQE